MKEKTQDQSPVLRQINIRLSDEEIAAIRDITKVDWIATATVALIRKAIEEAKK